METSRPANHPIKTTLIQRHDQAVHRNRSHSLSLGQGMMAGEPTSESVLLQTRLTDGVELDSQGELPGKSGVARFEWATAETFENAERSDWVMAEASSDFIVRHAVTGLEPDTRYHYRVHYAADKSSPISLGPVGSFLTLGGKDSTESTTFLVGSCMNYIKFMHGRAGNAGGPITATAEDKRLGFPSFETMKRMKPDFFVGTGDIVYYDNPFRAAKTVPELRKCWHEQFRFRRMITFFRDVPCFWSKDDHDFRYNDSDNESDRIPLPSTGINLFREQLPIAPAGDETTPNYRTHRVNRPTQIWLTEGRDHRSANDAFDGPNKSMWGAKQRQWLKQTLAESDAKWKIIISPTPMVGPDDAYKKDNHANLNGFRHEADEFFEWVRRNRLEDSLVLICGDRHWQYHSIHPSGVSEFAVGALNDENARMGVAPGDPSGSDPDRLVKQLYTSPTPSGGFLRVKAAESLELTHFNDDGERLYEIKFP